jgi:hypothetical protein
MTNRKRLVQLLIAFTLLGFTGITMLYAQSSQTLQNGVYRWSGISGEARIVFLKIAGSDGLRAALIVYAPDGSTTLRGIARISGSRVNVDYNNQGFETWTIIDFQTFKDDNFGFTWRWVRNVTQAERDLVARWYQVAQ